MPNATDKLESLISAQTVAVLAAFEESGRPVLCAVPAPRRRTGLKELWFMLPAGSPLAALYRQNEKADVYFYARKGGAGVHIRGRAAVRDDTASKGKLWREDDAGEYPKAAEDPGFCALRFTASVARYFKGARNQEQVV